MTKQHRKALIGLICVLTFSILILCVNAVNYPASYVWSLQNNIYFGFNNAITLSEAPKQGVANDSSLVGYWSANEGSGNMTYDLSGNGNNGTLYGPTWVNSTYGSALSFNGVNNYIRVSNRTSLILNNQFTLSFQFSPDTIKNQTEALIGKSYAFPNYEYYVYVETDGRLRAGVHTNSDSGDVFSNSSARLVAGGNYNIAITWIYPGQIEIYINGNLQGSAAAHNDTLTSIGDLVIGDLRIGRGMYSSGVFDNIRIYNRTLSGIEVAALYLQPDPVYSDSYYSFQDSATNSTLLIHIDNRSLNSNDSTLVTCTDFFTDNRLTFIANNSATMNLWSNLGRPVNTTGTWNNQIYTTTLDLNGSSIGKLDWNPIMPPSVSKSSFNSTYAGNATLFSALWSDNRSLSGGGYIFSTNNTGQWVNASWAAFSSSPYWGNATLTLNSQAGVVVGFREYANNSLNFWGDSGSYTITTTNESLLPSTPSPSTTPETSPNPSPTPTPVTTSSPTEGPRPSQTPTSTPSPIPIQNSLLSTQSLVIVGSAVALLVVLFAVAFKKGYVTIELIDEKEEEGEQWESQDYSI